MTLTVIVEHGKYFTTSIILEFCRAYICYNSRMIRKNKCIKMIPFDIVANLHKLVNKEPYRIMNVHDEKPDD